MNEQSGITAQNGTSGSIGGDVNLEGGYLVDESGTSTLTVDGTVNSTDIDNTANVSSTSISGGMNFGGPTDTPKDPAKGPSKPASSLNLPSHKENDTSSLTGGSFDDGAISGAFAESFNRQMHDREIQWIKENAEVFAAQQGISEKEAIAVLAQQALRMVDTTWKNVLDEDKVFGDKASDFLSDGGNGLFTASLKERDAYYTGFENIGGSLGIPVVIHNM